MGPESSKFGTSFVGVGCMRTLYAYTVRPLAARRQEPGFWCTLRSMPRARSLTHEVIADAALAVVDRDGLGALSMRSVAAELGAGAMSLYRYVRDRGELERLVVDRVLEAVDPAPPPRASWQRQVTVLAERMRAAVGAHPKVVPLVVAHRHSAPSVIRCAEAFLAALTRAGFDGRRRVVALRTLVSYVAGALEAQHLSPLAGPGTDALAALPATEFPLLAETARFARGVSADDEFRGGLAIVLRGLERSRPGEESR